MSRLNTYLIEAKKMSNTMIGFGIDKHYFKNIFSYIKSWLERYDINYSEVNNLHFSIAQITGTYDKDELVRDISKIDSNITFSPKHIKIFKGKKIPKDFIVLEYKPNIKFINIFNDIQSKYKVVYFDSIKPHISLFTIPQDSIDDKMFDDMIYGLPKIPIVKPARKELFNNKFEIEFKE